MTAIDVSVGLPPVYESAHHIATAEKLGYRRAYLYDTTFGGGDVWLTLHRAAELTTSIELGPGVLIPTQRHPMVNAAQTVSLHRLAPGRTMVAFGRGFSTCAAMGQPTIEWSYMKAYIHAYQELLAGQVVDWEGAPIKLMLTSEQVDALPLRIPLLVASMTPEGIGLTKWLGADGLISIGQVIPEQRGYGRAVVAVMGTVIDKQEDPSGERVRLAAGAPWAAATYHLVYTFKGAEAVHQMPGGSAWLDVIEKFPKRERHIHVHKGHMVEMNDADQAAWRAGGYVSLQSATLSGSADKVGRAVAAIAQAGATEVLYEPSGPDIARELEAFITAVRG